MGRMRGRDIVAKKGLEAEQELTAMIGNAIGATNLGSEEGGEGKPSPLDVRKEGSVGNIGRIA